MTNTATMAAPKTIALGDIFSASELSAIIRILEEEDYTKRINALKAYMRQNSEHIEAKGFLPEYLAYMLESLRMDLLGVAKPLDPSRN